MQKTLIATIVADNPSRVQGTYQSGHQVTFGDVTGFVFHSFSWDGRDIEDETLMSEPCIAELLKKAIDIGGYSDPMAVGFCDTGERADDRSALLDEIKHKATVIVYETD